MDLLFYIFRFVLHLWIVWGLWLLTKLLIERHLRQVVQKFDFRIKHKMSIFGKRVSSVKKGCGSTAIWTSFCISYTGSMNRVLALCVLLCVQPFCLLRFSYQDY